MLGGTHADVSTLSTEGVVITAQQARDMLPLAARRPSVGRWRVVIVEDADRLNDTPATRC
ncbi:hypothetical protein GCM10025868_18460 [Angustibacter aerolatus]|uniref:Uncharacterized protein n=1 Tax=Angustibacter aerolatus TaxID=1162965 RepID=A0ABQ6JGC1_9ACTN|nr:hypothetical protein GCM10025868_18460 [Angustibacter aerolatus]